MKVYRAFVAEVIIGDTVYNCFRGHEINREFMNGLAMVVN